MKLKQVDDMPTEGEFIAVWIGDEGELYAEVFWISDEGIKDNVGVIMNNDYFDDCSFIVKEE